MLRSGSGSNKAGGVMRLGLGGAAVVDARGVTSAAGSGGSP